MGEFRKKWRQGLAALLSVVVLAGQLQLPATAAETSTVQTIETATPGLCEHHPEHTGDCDHVKAEPGVDGCTLTINGGIHLAGNNTLTVYGGSVTATGGSAGVGGIKGAAIGGGFSGVGQGGEETTLKHEGGTITQNGTVTHTQYDISVTLGTGMVNGGSSALKQIVKNNTNISMITIQTEAATSVDLSFTVSPASLTITANNLTANVGDDISNVLVDITKKVAITSGELKNGDILRGITIDVDESFMNAAGTYVGALTPSNAVIEKEDGTQVKPENYNITYVSGTLTVKVASSGSGNGSGNNDITTPIKPEEPKKPVELPTLSSLTRSH